MVVAQKYEEQGRGEDNPSLAPRRTVQKLAMQRDGATTASHQLSDILVLQPKGLAHVHQLMQWALRFLELCLAHAANARCGSWLAGEPVRCDAQSVGDNGFHMGRDQLRQRQVQPVPWYACKVHTNTEELCRTYRDEKAILRSCTPVSAIQKAASSLRGR